MGKVTVEKVLYYYSGKIYSGKSYSGKRFILSWKKLQWKKCYITVKTILNYSGKSIELQWKKFYITVEKVTVKMFYITAENFLYTVEKVTAETWIIINYDKPAMALLTSHWDSSLWSPPPVCLLNSKQERKKQEVSIRKKTL